MEQILSLKKFKEQNPVLIEIFQDAFCRFLSNKDKKYIIEQIYAEDNREIVHLYGAYDSIIKNPYYKQGGLITYHDAEYNHRDKVFEVLRDYYQSNLTQYMERWKNQTIPKNIVVSFAQQLLQILANIEQGELSLLGLKPGNIFVIETGQNITLKVGGFVRSDKFLLSQPTYQSKDLQKFVTQCISKKEYNIAHRFTLHSLSLCYTGLLILSQFILQKDIDELGNFIEYLNNSNPDKVGSLPLDTLLNKIEKDFQGMRLFFEQSQLMLNQEREEPSAMLAIKFMSLATELRVEKDIILFGDYVDFKKEIIAPTPIIKKVLIPQKPAKPPKRTGGGFCLPKKK